jgi:hypothetical protein
MSRILKTDLPDFTNNNIGLWRINAVNWYNLRTAASLRNGPVRGWWQVVWFFNSLICSSRMFVIVNPVAPRQFLAAQCSAFLNTNQIQNGQVKPKSNCLG